MGRFWGGKTWEIPREDWDVKRDAVRQVLEEAARGGTTVPYSVITERVIGISGPDSHALAEIPGEICYENHQAGRSLLSAVATFKNDPNSVGVGFFNIAKQLGSVSDEKLARLSFWAIQLDRVYREYSD
jgi:hypothetical protein